MPCKRWNYRGGRLARAAVTGALTCALVASAMWGAPQPAEAVARAAAGQAASVPTAFKSLPVAAEAGAGVDAGGDAAPGETDGTAAPLGDDGAELDLSEAPAAPVAPTTQADAQASDVGVNEGGTFVGPNGLAVSNSPGFADAEVPVEPTTQADGLAARAARAAPAAASPGRGTVIGDNYPAKYKKLAFPYPAGAYIWDEWNFAYRQCTSFVAWRLNSANKVAFSNQYKGLWAWGDAGQWAASARSVGITVNKTPEVGAVAWSGPYYGDASAFGHVAWVAQVLDNGNIVIEEYNAGWAGSYGKRTIKPSAFEGYIHIADIFKPFTSTAAPTIAGAAVINGTLTANSAAWKPAVKTATYQWQRNGVAIPGATAKTYSPVPADLGAKLTVTMTGSAPGYIATAKTSAETGPVLMPDLDGDGIDDSHELAPWNTDVNGDGLPDLVGFGAAGPTVALASASGYGAASTWGTTFGTGTNWTNTLTYPRAFVDMNGDGKADVIGFKNDGVYVSLSTGSRFATRVQWSTQFGTKDGFDGRYHPRAVVDVTGDGLPDAVAIASDGVYVGVNTGKGFANKVKWHAGFGYSNGWHPNNSLRYLIDMNSDGKADMVGISASGISVALSTGKGFGPANKWSTSFGTASGWQTNAHPRTLADVDGDGKPDVVGFAADGVYVARNTGTALTAPTRWVAGFGTANGWLTGVNPRVLADVNGDGKADVVGFAGSSVQVALSTGKAFSAPKAWSTAFPAASWAADATPLRVTDVTGDGRADIVGFAADGVLVAASTGASFAAPQKQSAEFGGATGGWSVDIAPRAVGVQQLGVVTVPTLAGSAKVGQTLKGTAAAWQPAPVASTLQWLRNGAAIAGATKSSYTLTPQDLGAKVSLRTDASKPAYVDATRASAPVTVAKGTLAAALPTVTGQAKAGQKLTAHAGAWAPQPVALKYQWKRAGKAIAGATASEYKLTTADAGGRITVTVTGTKDAYENASTTSAEVRVAGKPPAPAASPFADVPQTHKYYREIAWMSTSGLSNGTMQGGSRNYQPNIAVSRGAMAAFLFRLAAPADYVAPKTPVFADVPVTHQFYREISWMRTSGLSNGTKTAAGLVYQPKASVSRQAMAAFLYRLEGAKTTPPAKSPFIDVAPGQSFYREIAWMKTSGLSNGTAAKGGRVYQPKAPVSRQAMAAFLYRLENG